MENAGTILTRLNIQFLLPIDLKDRSNSADSSGEEDSDEEEDRSMNNDTAPDQVILHFSDFTYVSAVLII